MKLRAKIPLNFCLINVEEAPDVFGLLLTVLGVSETGRSYRGGFG